MAGSIVDRLVTLMSLGVLSQSHVDKFRMQQDKLTRDLEDAKRLWYAWRDRGQRAEVEVKAMRRENERLQAENALLRARLSAAMNPVDCQLPGL